MKELGQVISVRWPFRTVVIYHKGRLPGGNICNGWSGVETREKKTGIIPLKEVEVRDTRKSYLNSLVAQDGHLGIPLKDLFVADQRDGLRSGPHIKIKP